MDKLQISELSTVTKKKKTNKGSSKVVELMDQSDIISGNPPANEPPDDNELAITGRQRGAKNYTYAELTLLAKCMKAAVPIGPQGTGDAINLYKRLAKDKGWAERGEKALRQKWDKVRKLTRCVPCPSLTIGLQKLQTTRPKSGEDELKEIIEEACRIEKDLQAKSGMVVVQDEPNALHWEDTYYTLITEDDPVATPPPDDPIKTAGGLRHNKPGSIIDLTASDDEPPLTRKVHTNTEVTVKQEITNDDVAAKATIKGKGIARPAKDGPTGGENIKVAAKSYRHGDGNGVPKTTKAETILANIADGLSVEAQEKREISRVNLLRESMNQERRDRMVDERVQDLRLEIQRLRKEIDDLRRENVYHRDRATEAVTTLSVLSGAGHPFMRVHNPPATYTSVTPAFATDPSPYSVSLTKSQSPEPEAIPGPGPQTMRHRQQDVEVDDSKIEEDE
jgi:hypothetical protein